MPKSLFYAGVASCFLLAGIVVMESLQRLMAGPSIPLLLPFVVALAVSIGSLFLRMAALTAARNLFSALFAVFATAATVILTGLLGVLEYRMTEHPSQPLSEISSIGYYGVGLFASLTLLSLRPYFRLQARALAVMATGPAALFLWMVGERLIGFRLHPGPSPVAFALAFLYALFLSLIAIHSLTHRRSFVEVTNLRELLDARIDPADPEEGRRFTFDRGVAFDS